MVGRRSVTEILDLDVAESDSADSYLNVKFKFLVPELSRFVLRQSHTRAKTVIITYIIVRVYECK